MQGLFCKVQYVFAHYKFPLTNGKIYFTLNFEAFFIPLRFDFAKKWYMSTVAFKSYLHRQGEFG